MKSILGVLGALGGGCALTTPAPAGPLRPGAYTQLETSWAVAYGPARATVDGIPVAGNGQSRPAGPPFPSPVPLTVGLRQAVGSNLEGSASIGWLDSGVGLRVGLPHPWRESLPSAVSAGLRSGWISAFREDTYEGRLALEIYPEISRTRAGSFGLMLSIGVAAGVFAHHLSLPDRFHSASDAPTNPPSLSALRREVRLQTAVGFHFAGAHGDIGVSLAPWILLAGADPTVACDDCNGAPFISTFAQTWGMSLILTLAVGWSHPPPT